MVRTPTITTSTWWSHHGAPRVHLVRLVRVRLGASGVDIRFIRQGAARDVLLTAEVAVHDGDLEAAGEKAVRDVRTYIKPALPVRRLLIRGRGPDLLAIHSSDLPLREPADGT
jgi:hypothetical protein